MSLPAKRVLTKRDENNVVKRVCRHCRLQFNSARALSGHLKIHYKDQKKTTLTRTKGRSKSKTNTNSTEIENINIELTKFLSPGWKFQGKRGSKGVTDETTSDEDGGSGDDNLNDANIYERDGEHDDDDDSEEEEEDEDEDDDGFNVMQTLRKYGFRDNAHRITKTRTIFICKTCDMRFPTFHAVLVHVNDHSDSSSADEENIIGNHFEPTINDEVDATNTIDGKDMGVISQVTIDDATIDGQKEVEEKEDKEEALEEMGDEEIKKDWKMGGDGPTPLAIVPHIASEEDSMVVANKEEIEGIVDNKEIKQGIVIVAVEDVNGVDEGAKAATKVGDDNVASNADNGCVDEKVSTSKAPVIEFDLNELPPNED